MKDVRYSIKSILESNSFFTTIMPTGFVLALIYPVLNFVNSLCYLEFYVAIRSVLYIAYLVGLLICFAEELDWAIGAAFAIIGLQDLIAMVLYFSFNALVYTVFYVALAVYFLKALFVEKQFNGASFGSGVNQSRTEAPNQRAYSYSSSTNSDFCSRCGKPVDPTGSFCPFCGTPYPIQKVNAQGEAYSQYTPPHIPQRSVHNVQYSGPAGTLASMCGSILALVFTILISANILISFIANFSAGTVITQIPTILICVGCWMIYTSCATGQLNESGFTLISGVLIAELVLCYILLFIGAIVGIILMFQGDDFLGIGIGIVISCFICAILYTMYLNGLRKTSKSAKLILRGEAYKWETSLFAIVLICISAFGQLISLATISSAKAYLNQLVNSLSYEFYYATGSSELSNVITNYLGSFTGGNNGLTTFSSLLSIAVLIYSAVILIQIRNNNK